MIGASSFWETEKGAPLLKRNCGYITEENAEEVMLQAQKLVDFVESFVSQVSDNESFDILSTSGPAVFTESQKHVKRERVASPEKQKSDGTPSQKGSEQRQQRGGPSAPEDKNFEKRKGLAEVEEKKQLHQSKGKETFDTPSQTVRTTSTAVRVSRDATTGAGAEVAGVKAAGHAAEKAGREKRGEADGGGNASFMSTAFIPLSMSTAAPGAGSSPPLGSPAVLSSSLPSTTGSSVVPPSFQRIFALDAERTFRETVHRQQMISVLSHLHTEVLDYHQGMGFLVAFLLLLLPPQAVQHVVVLLHRHYVPGYFAAAPAAYVRDARVYQKLLQRFYPDVAEHIEQFTCPEAYVSKWFIGMNIHVLPFAALMVFFENFFQKGEKFLFQFALALVKNVRLLLLQSHDVATILAILRLDEKLFPDNASIASALPYAAAAAAKKHSPASSPPLPSCSTTQTAAAVAAGAAAGRTCFSAAGDSKSDGDAADPDNAAGVNEREETHKEEREARGSFFFRIVEEAAAFDLNDSDIAKLRHEALEEMRVEAEKRKEREKQLGLDEDDEIVFSDEEGEEESKEEKEKREDE